MGWIGISAVEISGVEEIWKVKFRARGKAELKEYSKVGIHMIHEVAHYFKLNWSRGLLRWQSSLSRKAQPQRDSETPFIWTSMLVWKVLSWIFLAPLVTVHHLLCISILAAKWISAEFVDKFILSSHLNFENTVLRK